MVYFQNKPTPYNDYYIVRFLEDFSVLFEKIGRSVPYKFYRITEDMQRFRNDAKKWLGMYETDENEYNDFYFEEYDKLTSWSYNNVGSLIRVSF